MKRASRKWLHDHCVGLTYAHGLAQDALDSDARQRSELRRLRAFVRGCATYVCACGDGDICVGCAARQALKEET